MKFDELLDKYTDSGIYLIVYATISVMSTHEINIITLRYYSHGRFCACSSNANALAEASYFASASADQSRKDFQELPLPLWERVGVRVNSLTISSTASIEAGFARRLRPAPAKSRVVVQVRCVVLVLAAQYAVSTDFAHRVPVGELRMGNVACRSVGPFAARAAVATPVSGALPGLSSRFQYSYHHQPQIAATRYAN